MSKVKGLVKQEQIETFTLEKVQKAFEDGSIPEEKVVLVGVSGKIDRLQQRLDTLTVKKEYDLTVEPLDEDVQKGESEKDILEYDSIQKMYKAFGEVRIKCPRKSSYYLNLSLQQLEDGVITANGEQYAIGENMFITFDNTDEIVFSSSIYIWIKSITLTEYKIPEIPKKVSELDNDLDLVYIKADNEQENLMIKIGNKEE